MENKRNDTNCSKNLPRTHPLLLALIEKFRPLRMENFLKVLWTVENVTPLSGQFEDR